MAKDIRERLLEQAIKFHQWQKATYPEKPAEEIGSMWEVDYPYWNDTYRAFCHVLTQMDAETADSVLLDEMGLSDRQGQRSGGVYTGDHFPSPMVRASLPQGHSLQ